MNWTTQKPTTPGWNWNREDPGGPPILFYCGVVWNHIVECAGMNEPLTFMNDHLL